MLIAGDIGGTKTELALFSNEGGPQQPFAEAKFRSAAYPDLSVIVKTFLATVNQSVDRACFAVAGPVIDGCVRTTNLPWNLEEATLAKALNMDAHSVLLINDLEAIARAIPLLRPSDLQTINAGIPVVESALAVIAPGTGLGEAFLTWDESRYIAHSSEGGHADFAPTDERQIRLLQYMMRTFDHVSFEHVCSGIGLPNIYAYLRDVEKLSEDPEVQRSLAAERDPSVVIIRHAFGSPVPSPLCTATIDMFASILASEAANLAVKVLATGGVYLAGGVVTHTLAALQRPSFAQSFSRKGRLAQLVSRIPLHAVLNLPGLIGAAAYGLEHLKGS